MGRPKGSKNKIQTGTIGVGHNGPPADPTSDPERAAKFLNALTELERLDDIKAEALEDAKAIYSSLKELGYKAAQIKYALRLRREDPKTALDRHNEEMEIAVLLKHPIGTQFELFEDLEGSPNAALAPTAATI